MKESTKKLTALFLSMCMAASVLTAASVSPVSAAETESAVSYDDDYAPEIAADVTGMTEFVYYGGGSYYKYAADASGLIALKADTDNDFTMKSLIVMIV